MYGRIEALPVVILLVVIIVIAGAAYITMENYLGALTEKNIRIVDSYESEGKANILIANTGTKSIRILPCTGTGNVRKCGDLTIIKTSGEGELDLEIEQDVIEPGSAAIIKDKGASGRSSYKIFSPSIAVYTEVDVQALPRAEEAAPPVSEGIIAYWKFDGDLSDSRGTGYDWTGYGNPQFAEGKIGQGIEFDGAGDFLKIDSGVIPAYGVNGSLSIWFKPAYTMNSTTIPAAWGQTAIWTYGMGGGTYNVLRIYRTASPDGGPPGCLSFKVHNLGYTDTLAPYTEWQADTWYHAVATWEFNGTNTITRLYVNGVEAAPSDLFGPSVPINRIWYLGGYSTENSRFWNGTLDEFIMFDRALNASEVRELYEYTGEPWESAIAYYKFNGNANDETGNHHGTPYGVSFVNNTERRQVASFNGISFIIAGYGWLPTGDMAITVWVYAKTWGGGNLGRILASQSGQRFYLDGSGDTRLAFSSDAGGNKAHSAQNMNLNEWKHLVVNRIGNNIYFYIDGVESDGADPYGGIPFPGVSVYIGSNPSRTKAFNGYMDDLMIFDRALSEQEILDTFNWVEPRPGECKCSTCLGCTSKLNNPNCTIIKLTQDLYIEQSTWDSACIDVSGLNSKVLDCSGHMVHGKADTAGNRLMSPAIHIKNSLNMTVQNCVLKGYNGRQGVDGTYGGFNHGIKLYGTRNSTLRNNTLIDHHNQGIYLHGSTHNKVENNYAENNWIGFYCSDGAHNNTLTNNKAYKNKFGYLFRGNYNEMNNNLGCENVINNLPRDASCYPGRGNFGEGNILDFIEGCPEILAEENCSNYFGSRFPIVIVDTFGEQIPREPKIPANMKIIYDYSGFRNFVTDSPNDYEGWVGIEKRGQSSDWCYAVKKTYGFEIWEKLGDEECTSDENCTYYYGEGTCMSHTCFRDRDVSLMQFPVEEDWILKGDYSDKSLMRNVLTYELSNQIGRYATRTKYAEMFFNDSGILDYRGVYMFAEKIKRDSERVNITELTPGDNTEPEITGGYILKLDKLDAVDTYFYTDPNPIDSKQTRIIFVYPRRDESTPEQKAWIKSYMNEFEAALAGPNFADPVEGYSKYIDVDSFIDHLCLVELSHNGDALGISTYMYKDRNGKLNMGPVWDYDLAYGNTYSVTGSTEGWQFQRVGWSGAPVPFWWRRLMEDPNFAQQFRNRWFELRQNKFNLTNIFAVINNNARELNEAQERNFERWDILGTNVWPNPCGEFSNSCPWSCTPCPIQISKPPCPETHAGEVEFLKNWLENRTEWVDNNIGLL